MNILVLGLLLLATTASAQVARLLASSGHAVPASSIPSVRLVAAQPVAGIMGQPGVRWGFLPLRANVPSSVTTTASEPALAVSPVPAADVLTVQGLERGWPWIIVDILGMTVASGVANEHDVTVNVAHLPTGYYIVHVPALSRSLSCIVAR